MRIARITSSLCLLAMLLVAGAGIVARADAPSASAAELKTAAGAAPTTATLANGDPGGSLTGTVSDVPVGDARPVLGGPLDQPTLCWDAELTTGETAEARAALDELAAAVAERQRRIVLEAGDLLVVDNSRCVHGRSPFSARFDGTDRWLQRSFVVESLAPSAELPLTKAVRTACRRSSSTATRTTDRSFGSGGTAMAVTVVVRAVGGLRRAIDHSCLQRGTSSAGDAAGAAGVRAVAG